MNNTRRRFLALSGLALAGTMLASPVAAKDGPRNQNALSTLRARHSVRAYTKEPVSAEDERAMLEAAMCAPSAGSEKPWEFVVIRDQELLAQAGGVNRFAAYARNAPLGIMTCLNTKREKHEGMAILDVAACTQNLLLAAHCLGLGAVWTGVYPVKERVEGFQTLLQLPPDIIPVALVLVGHPRTPSREREDAYDAARVHQDKWQA